MIRIVADEHIPFLKGVLEPFASVQYLRGDRISFSDLKQADGLIIRTRTKCDATLLHGTSVRFIATATIGFDHIDTAYCQSNGISWHHAPGCNAGSVRQYVASALAAWAIKRNISLSGKTIGIVGVGNVGRKIVRLAGYLGMNPLLNDPPRERTEGTAGFTSIEEIMAEADIITFHVPLNHTGPFPTKYLINDSFLHKLNRKPLLINTSRGEVSDGDAIINALKKEKITGYITDVWEDEPRPDPDLIRWSEIATPHIAGYSVEGKANGTAACVRAFQHHFHLGPLEWYPSDLPLPDHPVIYTGREEISDEKAILEAIIHSYDITTDDCVLRDDPSKFEFYRNHYPARREFEAFSVCIPGDRHGLADKLKELGFRVVLQ